MLYEEGNIVGTYLFLFLPQSFFVLGTQQHRDKEISIEERSIRSSLTFFNIITIKGIIDLNKGQSTI